MAVEFQMPKLGLTMEEGLILEWLVPDGADVTEGTPVLIVQTDKVETEIEAPGTGRIAILGEVGKSFVCGEQIGWVLAAGEMAPAAPPSGSLAVSAPAVSPTVASAGAASAAAFTSALASSAVGSSAVASSAVASSAVGSSAVGSTGRTGRQFVSPNARRIAKELGVDVSQVRGTGPEGRVVSEDVESFHASAPKQPAGTGPTSGSSVLASYAASSLAELIGIDLRTITASDGGRIEKHDVVKHIRALITRADGTPKSSSAISGPSSLPPASQQPTSTIPMKGMRSVIATRMHESLREMAQLTLTMDVDMDGIVADRTKRKHSGTAPGYTDYVIAAAAKALVAKPFANSQISSDGVAFLPEVHVGMAVALDGGLVVPVIRNTDTLALTELAAETTRLATAARAGKLKLAELEGGTFSVTALGMFGVDSFTPVINPPNTAILGVGRIRDDVGWDAKGKPVRVQRLTLSLTWDHRAFDGAPAAELCAHIKSLLEDPATFQ